MENLVRYGIFFAIVLLLGFSLFHASWIAPAPEGAPKLVAGKLVDLPRDSKGCIQEAPTGRAWNSDFGTVTPVELQALQLAAGNSADGVVIESEARDGSVKLSRLLKFDCAADKARARTNVATAVKALAKTEQFLKVDDENHARALVAATPNASDKQIFFAATADELSPLDSGSSFSIETARQCASEYRVSGIWGSVPESCTGKTILLTLGDLGVGLWGWPDRFLARMAEANTRVIVAADVGDEGIAGLTELEQYSDIANSYNGYIWIDNIEELGPALKPDA